MGGNLKGSLILLFWVPRPTALTSASVPRAAELGGEVGPPVVRVLTSAPPIPSGICVVSKATVHIGSFGCDIRRELDDAVGNSLLC